MDAPPDAAIAARGRASFARQGAMATLGAELADVAAGRIAMRPPIEPRSTTQDGFLHAGVVVAALDSACGYAGLTVMPDDVDVLTIELKDNLLAPASSESLADEGEVVRSGLTLTRLPRRRLTDQGEERVHVATMPAAMMRALRRLTAVQGS
jgi:uncharacterized protein (TIGR00369 family)